MTFFGQLALLLFGEVGHREQVVVDERVVARHLAQLAAPNAVAAAVADVPDVHPVLLGRKERAHHGGPHAAALARLGAALEDLAVGDADAREQPVFLLRQARVEVERPGHVLGGRGAEELGDGVGREATRDVPGAVAPHPVGDDEQVVLGEDDEAVLVVLSLEADVTETRRDRAHCPVAPFSGRPPTGSQTRKAGR